MDLQPSPLIRFPSSQYVIFEFIQAYGMVITKGKEKLTTRTELNIRDTGIGKMVVLRDMDRNSILCRRTSTQQR